MNKRQRNVGGGRIVPARPGGFRRDSRGSRAREEGRNVPVPARLLVPRNNEATNVMAITPKKKMKDPTESGSVGDQDALNVRTRDIRTLPAARFDSLRWTNPVYRRIMARPALSKVRQERTFDDETMAAGGTPLTATPG